MTGDPLMRRAHNSYDFLRRGAGAGALAAAVMLLGSCGGAGGSGAGKGDADLQTQASVETGATLKIVPIGSSGAAVALFRDGKAYYSPDGYNLGGGGSTVPAYQGSQQVLDIEPVAGGIEALLSNGSAFFSPDGQNLGGGGRTIAAYSGQDQITSIIVVGSGVDAVLGTTAVYYSPDGLNLGGGGKTVQVYSGAAVKELVPMGGTAVLTLLSSGAAYLSPDNTHLGGGGATVSATTNPAIVRLVKVGGGVLAQFTNGTVYLSPDGLNLAGGGSTLGVSAWNNSYANGPWGARDSAHGTQFLGHVWLSGGFDDPIGSDSCFATCSYFDLWSSTDDRGASWNSTASFATASQPNPRDTDPVSNNGVMDAPVPTDFYDSYSAVVVWNGELTAIGATIWRSPDGVNWARNNQSDGTAVAGPVARRATENSRALVLGTTLYFLQPDTGEVYSTTDATASTWTDLGPIHGFAPRCGGAAFVLQGRMWIMGGGACNYSAVYHDIWSSADGVNWTQNTQPAAWSARMWPCVDTTDDGVVWLGGGYAPTDWTNFGGTITPRYGANHADVWYSKDGTTWKQYKADLGSQLPDDGGLEPRHAPTCYAVGNSPATFVLMGGTGGTDPNDANDRVLNSIRSLALPDAAQLP